MGVPGAWWWMAEIEVGGCGFDNEVLPDEDEAKRIQCRCKIGNYHFC